MRTLQHQLACCEAYAEQNPGIQFHVLGSGGSNQAVATTLHGAKRFRVSVNCLWAMRDAPDLDNTLNMLSALSFPGGHVPWSRPRKLVASLLGSLLGITKDKVTRHSCTSASLSIPMLVWIRLSSPAFRCCP